MKKIIPYIILAVVMLGILLFPVKTAAEYVRIEFPGDDNGELKGETCSLYYATAAPDAFNDDQRVDCKVDNNKKYIEFKLDGVLNNNIKGLRLDFPGEDQVFAVAGINVKSAGFVKKRFNPCGFFDTPYIKGTNDIDGISPIRDGDIAFVATKGEDPYIVFSDEAVIKLTGSFDHFIFTKLIICAFIAGCFFSYVKDPFKLRSMKQGEEE